MGHVEINQKAKVAKKDIVCYKYLRKTAFGNFSPYQHFEYILDKLYTTEITRVPIYFYYSYMYDDIHGGFYTLPSLYSAFLYYRNLHYIFKGKCECIALYKCIIPKGSTYYIDNSGECITNAIIIKKEITNKYLKWLFNLCV